MLRKQNERAKTPELELLDLNHVDLDPQHRQKMREALYGKKKVMKGEQEHDDPYHQKFGPLYNPDGQFAPQQSVMKSDFGRKELSAPVSYREASKNSTKSNWGLNSDTDAYNPVSTTRRDFTFRGASLYENPTASTKEAQAKTSPYFLDENYLKMGKSENADTFVTHKVAPVFDQKSLYKNKSNVSFGNEEDPTRFVSVMRSGLQEHKVMPSRDKTFEMDGKQSRNIYEWADGEKSDYKTVSQAAYEKPQVKKDQIASVDINFVKDLKGTHFTIGDDSKGEFQSQYRSSYLPMSSNRSEFTKDDEVAQVKTHIQLAEDTSLPFGVSLSKTDYTRLNLNDETVLESKKAAAENKALGKVTAVAFNLVDDQDRASTMKSVAQTQFIRPMDKDAKLTEELYAKAHATSFWQSPSIGLKQGEEPLQKTSVSKADYVDFALKGTDFKSLKAHVDVKSLVKPNVCLGTEDFISTTTSRESYKLFNPALASEFRGKAVCRRQTFEETKNSVLPRQNSTDNFASESATTYRPFAKDAYQSPATKEIRNKAVDYSHEKQKIPDQFITVSARTYVAPEIMKPYY